jgi:hypothetical protein
MHFNSLIAKLCLMLNEKLNRVLLNGEEEHPINYGETCMNIYVCISKNYCFWKAHGVFKNNHCQSVKFSLVKLREKNRYARRIMATRLGLYFNSKRLISNPYLGMYPNALVFGFTTTTKKHN